MKSDRLIKLRIEILTKSQFLLYLLLFFVGFLAFFIGGFFRPTVLETESYSVRNCVSGEDCFTLEDGNPTWSGQLNNLDKLNLFLGLRIIPSSSEAVSYSSDIGIFIQGLENESDTEGDIVESSVEYDEDSDIDCDGESCKTWVVFYEPFIEYKHYYVKLTFLTPIDERIDSMKIEFRTATEDFAKYLIIVRYIFLFLSLVSLALFFYNFWSIPFKTWTIESKYVALLGISLVLFNQPLYLVSVFEPSEPMSDFSAFSVSQFVFTMIVFWIILFQKNLKSLNNTWLIITEMIILCTFYIIMLVVFAYIHMQFKDQPSFDWKEDLEDNFKTVYVIFFVFLIILGLWLLLLIGLSFPGFFRLPASKKFVTAINVSMLIFTFVGFGVQAYRSFPMDGFLFMFYTAGFNFYVFILAFYFSPNKSSLKEFSSARGQDYEFVEASKNVPPTPNATDD